jgi:hypothetical protein
VDIEVPDLPSDRGFSFSGLPYATYAKDWKYTNHAKDLPSLYQETSGDEKLGHMSPLSAREAWAKPNLSEISPSNFSKPKAQSESELSSEDATRTTRAGSDASRPNPRSDSDMSEIQDQILDIAPTGAKRGMSPHDPHNTYIEFPIKLKRRNLKEGMGLNVDWGDMDRLRVTGIKPGLVQAWNYQNPSSQVKPGDYIVAINDAKGSSKQLLGKCREAKGELLMVISRRLDSVPGKGDFYSF